ncbi:hypothetical protein BUALT_Bualt08G0124400 [Buddleja alternifolia]|uniref:Synaptonemal complex protein 1 n=1 Tax=Buddleja alternifolia TaxID=168488 RepID=A0AAV6X7B8_9LAMI|nr:hypothetical protein BUALT_Bualt08G0124400 [Buddleja alternifolia]
MSRLLGLSGLKSLDQFKSSFGSNSGAGANAKILSTSSVAQSDSISSGSFANLKLTAEKLVREQASAKNDLELANSKLKKLTEQIRVLEDKLQNAFNENVKFKVKQKEDEKLWRGLESKFSSTKTLCDQLTETLQLLNVQVLHAEKDKAFFEDKLSATSVALDKLHESMKSMSLKLDSSEETIKNREKQLMELGLVKEKMETCFRDEQNRAASLIEEKEGTIKELEVAVAVNKVALESLTSQMEKLHLEMRVKEDDLLELTIAKEKLESGNMDLLSSKNDFANRLEMALKEIKNLEDVINMLVAKFTELENRSLKVSEKVIQLNASFDTCLQLAQQEKDLVSQCAKQKLDRLHNQWICVTSEKDGLQLVNQELNIKVLELQKEQEFAMVQHAEECQLTEEKIRKLEFEKETLLSKQTEMQTLMAKLEDNAKTSSENTRLSEKKMQDLLLKLSELENESKGLADELKADILKKQGELDLLQKEVEKSEESVDSLEKRISELDKALEEKDMLVLEFKTREKQFEDQKAEAINDIRRKYEVEKQESVNIEKEKADKVIQDLQKQCEEKISQHKEESRQYLLRVQEEHGSLISGIKQDYDNKERSLISKHSEEMRRTELQAESELREKTKLLRSEHEAQLRALRCEHEDECKRLQEELDVQKTKEERQRALLQLQWKVMGDNPQEDQEVTSKKNYIISSTKMRNSDGGKRTEHPLDRTEVEEKDSPYPKAAETPVSNLLKKVENVNTGSVMNIPKHSRKVTHHEYEIETSNGRTITKRRKTKSTVMFGEPRKHRKRETPKVKTPKNAIQAIKGGVNPTPSNIGDLFSEGSLNPYADDPYAFD